MPTITEAVQQSVSDNAKNQALKWVGQALLASAGAGAGARGLLGLYRLRTSPLQADPTPMSGLLPAEIPVPEDEHQKRANMARYAAKVAADAAESTLGRDIGGFVGGIGGFLGGNHVGVNAASRILKPQAINAALATGRGFPVGMLSRALLAMLTPTVLGTWAGNRAGQGMGADVHNLFRSKKAAGPMPAPAASPQPVQLKPSPGAPTAASMKAWNNLNAASAGLRAPAPAPRQQPRKPSPLDAMAAQLGRGQTTPAAPALAAQPRMQLAPTTGVPRPMAGPAEMSKVQQLRPAPAPTTAITKRSNALKFLSGDYATKPSGVPWALPATVLGGAAGAAGGWKLVDYLLDKRRKAEIEQDVNQAQQEFQQALQSSYGSGEKAASQQAGLGAELDALYDQFQQTVQKTAGFMDDAGLAAGVVGTGMGSLGMLAALMSYQEASKRRRSTILNKARTAWQRRMWRDQPPAVVAQPMRKPPAAIVPTQTEDDTTERQ